MSLFVRVIANNAQSYLTHLYVLLNPGFFEVRTNVLRACQTLINYNFLGAIDIICFFAILLILGLIKLISSNHDSNFIYRVYF